tara:strand:+ start:907 stop:1149 length:243 start_codon:yes stop_codon:yes gene_type:complete
VPWNVVKRKCKQSSGKSGNYAVVKKKGDSTEQSSCHTSKEKAEGSVSARGMHEDDDVQEESLRVLRNLIREELRKMRLPE